jgi:hypothetical protein
MASRHSYRLRSRADRAGRLPHAGRRRRAARPGLPLEARLDPRVRARQRASLRPCTPARRTGRNRCSPKRAHRDWRNGFYDPIAGPKLQAVVAFGDQAREAVCLWSPPNGVEPFEVPHPSSHNETVLLSEQPGRAADAPAVEDRAPVVPEQLSLGGRVSGRIGEVLGERLGRSTSNSIILELPGRPRPPSAREIEERSASSRPPWSDARSTARKYAASWTSESSGGIRTVTGTGLPVTAVGRPIGLSVRSQGGGSPTSWSCSISR